MPRRWHRVREIIFADGGGKKARSPGRARIYAVNTTARGMPDVSGVTVVTNARVYYSTRAAADAPSVRHSLLPSWGSTAPSNFGAKLACKVRAHRAARSRRHACHFRGDAKHRTVMRNCASGKLEMPV